MFYYRVTNDDPSCCAVDLKGGDIVTAITGRTFYNS
jgi:hypothetical protein